MPTLTASKTWHARLGHVSMNRIRRLFARNEEYGLPNIRPSEITCEDCLKCKSSRKRKLGSTNWDPAVWEVLVTVIAGLFTLCLSGEKLMVMFCDIALTYSDISIIKAKSEVPHKLMHVIKKWERETGRKIKIVRSDRGGEYIGAALDKWLRDKGITHELSNPYKPEQNGVAERLNCTLGEMAWTLLSASKLPKVFWNHANMTAAYIHNRLPNSVTRKTTRYEMFHGRKPDLGSLRTFGSVAFVHIHAGQRPSRKLEDRGRKCVMIGYIPGGKGWMFHNESTKTIFPLAIARFPYETVTLELPEAQLTKPSNRKGSLQHIMNSLKLGDFSKEMKLDKQDAAALVALDSSD